MRKLLLVLLIVSGVVYAHGTILVQSKSFEFYDKAGIVSIDITEDNTLRVRLNTFELGARENFCELK